MDNEFKEKLCGYEEIKPQDIKKGDHIRVTLNKYKEEGRKCSYYVIKEVHEDGTFTANSYKPIYPDWIVKPDNKFKQYVFYKKPDLPLTTPKLVRS